MKSIFILKNTVVPMPGCDSKLSIKMDIHTRAHIHRHTSISSYSLELLSSFDLFPQSKDLLVPGM